MSEKDDIQELHERMLRVYEEHRGKNPGFTFYLRKLDTKGRLSKGYWFRGDDNYISTSPYRLINSKLQKMGCISFNVDELKGKGRILLLVEKRESLASEYQHWGDFLEEITKMISLKKRYRSFEKGRFQRWVLSEDLDKLEKELSRFLNEDVPVINSIADKDVERKDLFFSEVEFRERYRKVKNIRAR